MVTRDDLALLSAAHAVAMSAIAAPETGHVPDQAAMRLAEISVGFASDAAFPDTCRLFALRLREHRRSLRDIAAIGRLMRDEVCRAMAFQPVDLARVDIHG